MARAFGQAVGAPGRLPRRVNAAARHGRPLDPRYRKVGVHVTLTPSLSPASRRGVTLDPFYPIVNSAAWVARLVGAGARLIQLRIKHADGPTFARETRAALARCRMAGATLVVNDDWRAAIDEGAEWVHLGQEDLDTADLAAIRRKGLRLGVSTSDEAGLERGLAVDPDYVAFGPVFPTISKDQAVAPLGLEGLSEWKRRIGALPLCAIGGIDLHRAKLCLAAGADIVSVISDITLNADPEARAREWIAAIRPA